jgi:hypothetical protein
MAEDAKQVKEEHIGDGVYISFDGFGFTLRAPRENGDHWIYIEPTALRNLLNFVAHEIETKEAGYK